MSMGDSPKDCEEMGDEDDGRSIAEVATAGREIGGCKGHEMLNLASRVLTKGTRSTGQIQRYSTSVQHDHKMYLFG